jgi:hypothetical protein
MPEVPEDSDSDAQVQDFILDVERLLRSEVDSWSEQARRPDAGGSTN